MRIQKKQANRTVAHRLNWHNIIVNMGSRARGLDEPFPALLNQRFRPRNAHKSFAPRRRLGKSRRGASFEFQVSFTPSIISLPPVYPLNFEQERTPYRGSARLFHSSAMQRACQKHQNDLLRARDFSSFWIKTRQTTFVNSVIKRLSKFSM